MIPHGLSGATPPVTSPGNAGRAALSPPACPWTPIIASYCVYVAITFIGGVTGLNLQIVGAAIFLAFITLQYGRYYFPLVINYFSLATATALVVPLAALLLGAGSWYPGAANDTAKYVTLIFLIGLFSSMALPPLYQARSRWWGLGFLLGTLLYGLLIPYRFIGGRIESIFANPNNFALAAIALLFFLDVKRDPRWLKWSLHALVVLLLLASGTAGALMGYGVGLVVYALHGKYSRPMGFTLIAIAVLGIALLVAVRGVPSEAMERMGPLGQVLLKVHVAQDNFDRILSGSEINYWEMGREYGGAELTSGVWRLMQWREVLQEYWAARWLVKLLGHGLRSSEIILDHLPHNDYLRLLYEIGLLGLAANLTLWIILFRRMVPSSRWVVVMMATYALTENNFDNLLVMSLFVLYATTARTPSVPARLAAATEAPLHPTPQV